MATAFYSDDYVPREGEEWLPVSGFEDYFQISSFGTVRSVGRVSVYNSAYGRVVRKLRSRIIRHVRRGLYPSVSLWVDGEEKQAYVHRLVCEAFHGPCPDDCTDAAHIDGNRDNPRADNLRWTTRKDNMADCRAHGTYRHGESHQTAILTDAQVSEIRLSDEPPSIISKRFNISPNYVHDIRGNRRRRGP